MKQETLTDKERIARLEMEFDYLKQNAEEEKNKRIKLKTEIYQLKKELRFHRWIGRAWKNFAMILIPITIYFCVVDMLFSTEKFHAWFFQTALPWGVQRVLD